MKQKKSMREDEQKHGRHASENGAKELPKLVKYIMSIQSKVMTNLSYFI